MSKLAVNIKYSLQLSHGKSYEYRCLCVDIFDLLSNQSLPVTSITHWSFHIFSSFHIFRIISFYLVIIIGCYNSFNICGAYLFTYLLCLAVFRE